MLAAFVTYFRNQPIATRRAMLHERVSAYLDHPLVTLIRESLPEDLIEPFDRLLVAARRSAW